MEPINNLEQLNVYLNKTPLFIDSISVFKKDFELTFPTSTAYGNFKKLTRYFPQILFKNEQAEIIPGIGECSPLNLPYYNSESSETVNTALKYIIKSLKSNKEPITDIYSFKKNYDWIVGHNIAKCGIEGAYWTALSYLHREPIKNLWGGTRKKVEAGVSIGIEDRIDNILIKVHIAVDRRNAKRVKVKIKPGKDITVIEAIRKKYPNIQLQVDANASYDLFNIKHLALLKELDNYNLLMIEQPGLNDDIYYHAKQLKHLSTPICLDESITSIIQTKQAIEFWEQHSTLDKLIINIKPARVGGYLEAIRIANLCAANNIKTWCGGMYESGLGKTMNIILSSRSEFNLPGDHVSIAPYFLNDEYPFTKYKDGYFNVPTTIGA